jgi:outer membrane protein insertion porin family
LLLAGCIACGATAWAAEGEAPVINDIVIEGTVRLHPDRVRMRLQLRPGDRYDPVRVADDIKAIHEMRAFAAVRSEVRRRDDGRIDLVLHVRELPYVGAVRFVGVGFWDEVEDLVATRQGSHLDPHTLERDRLALERYFREKNFLHVTVTVAQAADAISGICTVTFTIDRGQEVFVDRTIYDGLPDEMVKLFVDGRLTNRPQAAFVPDLVAWDARAVETYLHDQGWREAVVTGPRVEFFDSVAPWERRHRHGPRLVPEGIKQDRVVLTFTVAAGPRYRLGGVRFVGSTVASESELRAAFGLPDGTWYIRSEIEAAARQALKVVRNQGYARARYDDQPPRYDHDAKTVHLTLHLIEGDRYRIGRIDPVGNTVTQAQIIYRDMELGPGDLWNEDAIDESKRQLERIGIFKQGPPRPLEIVPVFPPERPTEVDLRVMVEEDDTAIFSAMGGWSSSSGFQAQASLSEYNFDTLALLHGEFLDRGLGALRGGGHQLSTQFSLAKDATSFGISWRNPRVLDSRYALDLSFQRRDAADIDWDEVRQITGIGVGRSFLQQDLTFSLGYSYTDLDIKQVDLDAADQTLLHAPADFHINALSFSQIFDRRDSRLRPTSGFVIQLAETVAGQILSASHEYYRLSLDVDGYLPFYAADLGGVTFLHLGQRLGLIDTFSADDQVPFYTRFYGGGPTHHRGYGSYELGPTERNFFGYTAHPGGTREWLSTAELFVPLQGTRNGFHLVGFTDIGQVWGDRHSFRTAWGQMPIDDYYHLRDIAYLLKIQPAFANFSATGAFVQTPEAANLSDLKVAVGMGVRFPTFLPVAIDLAWLLNGDPGDEERQFHFTMRKSF